jgi:ATP-binding cassette subfamily B protein
MSAVSLSHDQVDAPSRVRFPVALLRRALVICAPNGLQVALATLLSLAAAALGVGEPLLLMRVIDSLSAHGAGRAFVVALLWLVALECARALLNLVVSWRTWDIRLDLEQRLRAAMADRLKKLALPVYMQEGVGGLLNKFNTAANGVVSVFADFAFTFPSTVLYLVLAVWAMARMNVVLSLVVLAFAPLPALIGMLAAPEQTRRQHTLLDAWTALYARLYEVLAGIGTVRSFAMETQEYEVFLAAQDENYRIVKRGAVRDALTTALGAAPEMLARLAVLACGGYLVVRGHVTLGSLVAFLGFIGGLFQPVQTLTKFYQTAHQASAALTAMFEIMDGRTDVPDRPDATELPPLRGHVTFDRVSFSYGEKSPVLHDVSLDIAPGETVAIVGPSGAGKSTVISLLQRFISPDAGTVRVDGVDVAHASVRSLRRQVIVVEQHVHIFNDTVRANIAYGKPDATDADVEAAARAAHAHEFIARLPRGYDTVLGEGGKSLSGGQRQRLALARALVREAPILVLDEATSALDSESEAMVQDAIAAGAGKRTTIIVAHRLATVMSADRIVVLRDGRIEAIGTHRELLRRSACYANLVRHQMQGLLAA